MHIDFTDVRNSDGYNPMRYIRYDTERQCYNEQDIMTAAACIVPEQCEKEPFWTMAARTVLESMIAYVLETCPESERKEEQQSGLPHTPSPPSSFASSRMPI